jgi:hypothetical protein
MGGVFDIKNSRDFLEKLYQEYADFDKNRQSTRLAITGRLVMCLESCSCFPKCPWHREKDVTLTHILSVPETPLSRG